MPIPFVPVRPLRPPHDPIDLAVRDVELAAADFMVAILAATTVDQCLRLRRRIEAATIVLNAMSSAALERADKLCQEKD
jgi:hypothetical protein